MDLQRFEPIGEGLEQPDPILVQRTSVTIRSDLSEPPFHTFAPALPSVLVYGHGSFYQLVPDKTATASERNLRRP
jgi:hypothetical protein